MIVISNFFNNFKISDWLPITKDCHGELSCSVSFDLESSPLQIKVAGNPSSGPFIVFLYDSTKVLSGIYWKTSTWWLGSCSSAWSPYQTTLEVTNRERIWTVIKNTTHVTTYCEDVLLFQYRLSDSTLDTCKAVAGDVVEKISFYYLTSGKYRQGKSMKTIISSMIKKDLLLQGSSMYYCYCYVPQNSDLLITKI